MLQEVVCAFITFKSEDGHDAALDFSDEGYLGSVKKLLRIKSKKSKDKIFGKKPTFIQAEEPTNVIWENQSIKGNHYIKRAIKGSFFILVLLFISFSSLLYLMHEKVTLRNIYPVVNCDLIYEDYSTDMI